MQHDIDRSGILALIEMKMHGMTLELHTRWIYSKSRKAKEEMFLNYVHDRIQVSYQVYSIIIVQS